MSLHHCSAVSHLVHLSLRSAAVKRRNTRTCRDEKTGRGGRSGEGRDDGDQGEEIKGTNQRGETEMGETEMKRGTIKDLRACGGSVEAGGL